MSLGNKVVLEINNKCFGEKVFVQKSSVCRKNSVCRKSSVLKKKLVFVEKVELVGKSRACRKK